jgi:hypothetical protein
MKKAIVFMFIVMGMLLFEGATWDESQKPIKQWNGNYSYNFVATFAALDTIDSRTIQITRDRDVSWVTFPFYCDVNITHVDSVDSGNVTIVIFGGFDDVIIPCDTLFTSIGSDTTDTTWYQTFDLNDKKYPNYLLQIIGDSCTVDLQFY